MWLVRRCRAQVHLLHDDGQPLSEARQRTADGLQAQPPFGIDIHVEVPAVKYEKLADDRLGESSAVVSYARGSKPRARSSAGDLRGRPWTAMPTGTAKPSIVTAPLRGGAAEIRQFCRVDESRMIRNQPE
jgi:hypothetical protein